MKEVAVTDWLTRGISEEELKKEKEGALSAFRDNFIFTSDFECYVIKYDHPCPNGKLYKKDCFKNSHGGLLPLLWNHNHNDPSVVLGEVLLLNSDDGIYVYGRLNDHDRDRNKILKEYIKTKALFVSPYINVVKSNDNFITGGVIREVSFCLARVDPDDSYIPVMRSDIL